MQQAALRWALPAAGLIGLAALVWAVTTRAVDPELAARNATLEAELARVNSANARLEQQASALRAELTRLRERPEEQLHHARTQLGMVKPGEVVYQLDGHAGGP